MPPTSFLHSQLAALRVLWRQRRFRAPLVTIWVASYGGALHAPVTTGYLRKVGATTTDVGTIGAVVNVGTVLLSPFYGWLLDRHGGFVPIVVTCSFCALGCAVRGFAGDVNGLFLGSGIASLGAGNLWTVVLSYISANTDPAARSTMVSAFLFQVAALRLVGKFSYPLFDWAVHSIGGVDDELLRDRVAMSVCTIFCFFGVFLLMLMPGGRCVCSSKRQVEAGQEEEQEEGQAGQAGQEQGEPGGDVPGEGSGESDSGDQTKEGGAAVGSPLPNGNAADPSSIASSPSPASHMARWPFAVLSVVLFVQAVAITSAHALWPFVLQDNLHIGSRGYGVVLFTLGRGGGGGVGGVGGALAANTSIVEEGFTLAATAHVCLTALASVSLTAAEPVLKSLTSLRAPPALHSFPPFRATQTILLPYTRKGCIQAIEITRSCDPVPSAASTSDPSPAATHFYPVKGT